MSRRRLRPAGRCPANSGVVLREAGARAEGLLEDRRAEALGERHERRPGLGLVGAGAHDQRGRLGRGEQVGERLDRRGVGRAGAEHARRRRQLVRLGRGRQPVVHRHDDERRPARGARLVPRARERARHVLRAHGLDRRTPGSRRPARAGAPARNGSWTRWRRSCWPTSTTSGARLTRAVASAATALPRPRSCAGSPSPARRGRSPSRWPCRSTEPSCSPSTKRRSSGRPASRLHLGRAGVGEQRRQAALAQDVERGVADRPRHAWTTGVPYVWKLSTVWTPHAWPRARSASLQTIGSKSGSYTK